MSKKSLTPIPHSKNRDKKFYFFIGTTAELIRISPILNKLVKDKVYVRVITSGQTKVLFDDLAGFTNNLRPDIELPQKLNRSSVLHFIFWAIRTFFVCIFYLRKEFGGLNRKNSYFVICGDPVSTSIGAVVAKLFGLRIVHIESGDLSGSLMEPFPEEICRNINIRLAEILFPPSEWAKDNLKKIKKPKINTHYNTMLEGFWWFMKRKVKTRLELRNKKYYILILHRQEHILFGKKWSKKTLNLVIDNADPKLICVLFNHPLTKEIIKSLDLNKRSVRGRRIILMPPVSYPEFLKLARNSEFIASDGATNQFEAYLMGKPCLVLRDRTEQIEGLGGNAVLYKSDESVLKNFLLNYKKYKTMPIKPKIKPSSIIVNYLYKYK